MGTGSEAEGILIALILALIPDKPVGARLEEGDLRVVGCKDEGRILAGYVGEGIGDRDNGCCCCCCCCMWCLGGGGISTSMARGLRVIGESNWCCCGVARVAAGGKAILILGDGDGVDWRRSGMLILRLFIFIFVLMFGLADCALEPVPDVL